MMSERHASGARPSESIISRSLRLGITAILIGCVLAAIFRAVYSEVPLSEVITVIALVAIGLAIVFGKMWKWFQQTRGS